MSGRIRRARYACQKCGEIDSTLLYENEHTPAALNCCNCHGKDAMRLTGEETYSEEPEYEPEENDA